MIAPDVNLIQILQWTKFRQYRVFDWFHMNYYGKKWTDIASIQVRILEVDNFEENGIKHLN